MPDRFVLQTSARGPHRVAISALIGGLLFVLAAAYWTRRAAAGGNQLALMVSLPAGLLGIVNVLRATYAMLQHHRIELSKGGGWITVLPIGRKTPLRTDNLRLRFDHVVRGDSDGTGGTAVPVLIAEDDAKTFRLLEGATDAERRWVRAELNLWLARHGRT